MNQKQLYNFLVLYNNRSISLSAEELFMTRQALSLNLRKLEEELGAQLFYRVHDGVVPTAAGEKFHHYAVQLDWLWSQALKDIKVLGHSDQIQIAMHVMYYTHQQLRQIKETCLRVTGQRSEIINICEGNEGSRMLESGEADIVLTHKPPDIAGLLYKKAMDSKACLLMHRDDPLTEKTTVDFACDLMGRELVFLSRETMNEVAGILRAQDARFEMLASDRVLLQETIETDHLLTVIPAQCASVFVTKDLVTRPLINFPVMNGVYVNYRGDNYSIAQLAEALYRIYRPDSTSTSQ